MHAAPKYPMHARIRRSVLLTAFQQKISKTAWQIGERKSISPLHRRIFINIFADSTIADAASKTATDT
jgi:hypothetical protein